MNEFSSGLHPFLDVASPLLGVSAVIRHDVVFVVEVASFVRLLRVQDIPSGEPVQVLDHILLERLLSLSDLAVLLPLPHQLPLQDRDSAHLRPVLLVVRREQTRVHVVPLADLPDRTLKHVQLPQGVDDDVSAVILERELLVIKRHLRRFLYLLGDLILLHRAATYLMIHRIHLEFKIQLVVVFNFGDFVSFSAKRVFIHNSSLGPPIPKWTQQMIIQELLLRRSRILKKRLI